MNPFLKITVLMIAAAVSVFAQNASPERKIRSFLAEYEQAVIKRDVAFMERALADDYTYSGANGMREDRTQCLVSPAHNNGIHPTPHQHVSHARCAGRG